MAKSIYYCEQLDDNSPNILHNKIINITNLIKYYAQTQSPIYNQMQPQKLLALILLTITSTITISITTTAASVYSTQPVWVTSPYVRAGNEYVIANVTNMSTVPVPTHRFVFSQAFSGTPNLGYGIKDYEALDYLGEEMFEITRTYLDRYEFRVRVRILSTTNILLLNVPYIAIDPAFPHHLNSFDNVPINYMAGPLTNITTNASSSTYSNTINYTQQAAGLNYTTFQPPFHRNKVLLFITCMYFFGFNERYDPPPFRPINFTVSAKVVSVDQYKIEVNLSTQVYVTRLRFSMIIFDQVDVQNSGQYMLVYDKITLPYTGGFIPVPAQFVDNFIMGLIEFTSNKTGAILDFQWDFQTINGTHGAYMIQSVGVTNRPNGAQTINTVTYTLFYMKTWLCPNTTKFDPVWDLCVGDYPSVELDYSYARSGCNEFTLNISYYETVDAECLKQGQPLTPSLHITSISTLSTHLQYQLSYTTDIYNQTLQLLFPCTPHPLALSFTYSSMLPPLHYNESQCAAHQSIKDLLLAVEIISYVILIMSLLSFRLVGLELFGVLQLAYFSLASYDFYNIYLHPLTGFKTLNGLNLPFIPERPQLPASLQQMKIHANFLNNCNIMLILLFAQLIISTILYIVSRVKKMKKLKSASIRMLKQGFISLVFFNLFNISFSIGVDYKYSGNKDDSIGAANIFTIIVTMIAIIISSIALQITSERGYGQLKYKFKNSWSCRVYILVSILYRFSLGVYIALHNEYPESTLIVLSFSLAFIMYNIINLPFSQALHNYRSNLIHLTQLVILFSANYYRSMKMNTPMEVKARIYSPAVLELVLIVLCITFSAFVLVYEIYRIVRKIIHNRKVVDEEKSKNRKLSNQTISSLRD